MDQSIWKDRKSVLKRCLSRILHRPPLYKPYSGTKAQPTGLSNPDVKAAQLSKEPKKISWTAQALAPRPTPSFQYFALLPTELRIQIWELALFSTPRFVEFIEVLNINSSKPCHFLLSTPVPPSLQICQEARNLALSRYIFSTGNLKLYLDPRIDTLCFGEVASHTTFQIFILCAPKNDMAKLDKLCIKEKFLDSLARPVRMMEEAIQTSNRLQWISDFDDNRSGDSSNCDIRENMTAGSGVGAKSCEKPFKLLCGLSELVVLPSKSKIRGHGESTLGFLEYEKDCSVCTKIKDWQGFHGWVFPTYEEFVRTECNGVEDESSEEAYRIVVNNEFITGTRDWLRSYVKRVVLNERDGVVGPRGKFRACQIAELHRFIDVKD